MKISEEDVETVDEVEVFLRMLSRMPVDEYERRRSEISEACVSFADYLTNMLHPSHPNHED